MENHEFLLAEQFALHTDQHIFLTGKAGTGKTTLLKHIAEKTATPAPVVPPSPAGRSKTKPESAGPAIDGIVVRGLYLYNPKQQEIVVDYLHNLADSPFFIIDAKKPERVIISNSVPNDAEWAFPYELQLTLRKPVKLP